MCLVSCGHSISYWFSVIVLYFQALPCWHWENIFHQSHRPKTQRYGWVKWISIDKNIIKLEPCSYVKNASEVVPLCTSGYGPSCSVCCSCATGTPVSSPLGIVLEYKHPLLAWRVTLTLQTESGGTGQKDISEILVMAKDSLIWLRS